MGARGMNLTFVNEDVIDKRVTFLNEDQVAAAQSVIALGLSSSIKIHSDLSLSVIAEGSHQNATHVTWLQLPSGELKTFHFSESFKCDWLSLTYSPRWPGKLACQATTDRLERPQCVQQWPYGACQGMNESNTDDYRVVSADGLLVSARLRPFDGENSHSGNRFTLQGSHYIVELPSSTCGEWGSACQWPDPPPPSPWFPPLLPPHPPGLAPDPPPPPPHPPDAEFLLLYARADALPDLYERKYVRAMQILSGILGKAVNRVLHVVLIDDGVNESNPIVDGAGGGHSAVFALLKSYGYGAGSLDEGGELDGGCCLCGVGKMHSCIISKAFMDHPHGTDTKKCARQ